ELLAPRGGPEGCLAPNSAPILARPQSIHHSVNAIVPALGPTWTGADHVWPPSDDRVKYSPPGLNARVVGSVWWPKYRASIVPFGCTTMGPPNTPPSGKPGLTGWTAVQVLPPSVDFWITALLSPAAKAQLPVGEHRNW